ncbi:MAG: hypothetical protein E7214_10700 [Clostridium sp.]|nr:hypothetical protein [Clostridium sp.]
MRAQHKNINMKKKYKNIKMTNILGAIAYLASFLIFVTGVSGIYANEKLNRNMHTIIEYKDWREEVVELKATLKEIYDSGIDNIVIGSKKDIDKQVKIVDDFFAEINSLDTLDEEERKYCNNIESYYNELKDKRKLYMSNFENIKLTEDNVEEYGEELEKSVKSLELVWENVSTELDNFSQYINSYTVEAANQSRKIAYLSCGIIFLILVVGSISFIGIAIFLRKAAKDSIDNIKDILKNVSDGNLAVDFDYEGKSEFAEMRQSIKSAIGSFGTMILGVNSISNNVNTMAKELSSISSNLMDNTKEIEASIEDVTNGTIEQANDLVKINNALDGFSEVIEGFIENLKHLNSSSYQISNSANVSNEKMDNLAVTFNYIEETFKNLVERIDKLGANISKVNDITTLIDDISEQTNLLALNAAIEAARAGEAGKGFAVVAEEIRKLAEQSKVSAGHISDLVSEVSGETSDIVNVSDDVSKKLNNSLSVIGDSIDSFNEIVDLIEDVVPRINSLTDASNEIGKEKGNIVEMVENASAIAEEVSASAQEITGALKSISVGSEDVGSRSKDLSELTNTLKTTLDEFNI